jgi:hypothetical protein
MGKKANFDTNGKSAAFSSRRGKGRVWEIAMMKC